MKWLAPIPLKEDLRQMLSWLSPLTPTSRHQTFPSLATYSILKKGHSLCLRLHCQLSRHIPVCLKAGHCMRAGCEFSFFYYKGAVVKSRSIAGYSLGWDDDVHLINRASHSPLSLLELEPCYSKMSFTTKSVYLCDEIDCPSRSSRWKGKKESFASYRFLYTCKHSCHRSINRHQVYISKQWSGAHHCLISHSS